MGAKHFDFSGLRERQGVHVVSGQPSDQLVVW